MKYLIFSFDDGTIHDIRLIELFNKYNLKATFNLNSGLDNYVWYSNNTEIRRLTLKESIHLYDRHEVCCHSLTHPHLDECDSVELLRQVKCDKENLERIFNKTIDGFATPFETYNEEVIKTIKDCGFKYIRLPLKSNDTLHLEDPFHISCNCFTFEYNVKEKIEEFLNNGLEEDYLVIAGHSYEYYLDNSWDDLDSLLCDISKEKRLKTITTSEFLKLKSDV